MNNRNVTAAAILAVSIGVVGTSVSASAYSDDAVKRAIITTVLANLGVEATDDIVDALIAEIPIETLAPSLVAEVGAALDAGDDPTLIIGQTVDSDGDGVPNESAAMDAEDDESDESDDEEDESDDDSNDESDDSQASNAGGSNSTGGNGNKPNDDDEADNEDDEADDEDDEDDEDDDDSDDDSDDDEDDDEDD